MDALYGLVMIGTMSVARPSYVEYDSSHLRAAGITHRSGADAAGALAWQNDQRPETPTGLKKYRQSTLHTPGQIFRHFGVADDVVDAQRTYGKVGA